MRLSAGLRLWFICAGLSLAVVLSVALLQAYALYKGFNAVPDELFMFTGMLMMIFFGAWIPQILCLIGILFAIHERKEQSDARFIVLGFYLNVAFMMGATVIWWLLV